MPGKVPSLGRACAEFPAYPPIVRASCRVDRHIPSLSSRLIGILVALPTQDADAVTGARASTTVLLTLRSPEANSPPRYQPMR